MTETAKHLPAYSDTGPVRCLSETWDPDGSCVYESGAEFLDMCQAVFGDEPARLLRRQGGLLHEWQWVDSRTGRVVLVSA